MEINSLVRQNILSLKSYSTARSELSLNTNILLDENENPFNTPFNRYPDSLQKNLKNDISEYKKVPAENIFLGNGSIEIIDLLYRVFCEPTKDNVVAIEPTCESYAHSAAINNVEYRRVCLNSNFDIEAYQIMDATNVNTKIIWLCSPNNPSGNTLNYSEIIKILDWFRGIVVIDEAYIDFSQHDSFISHLATFPNLVVLQTFSKAFANAAIRLGTAFAAAEIIAYLNKVKYPYNVNLLTQHQASLALENSMQKDAWVREILAERKKLVSALEKIRIVERVYPTDANFVLIKVIDAKAAYNFLVKKRIIVSNQSHNALCENCLRITVGTANENKMLVESLKCL
jgi:histidinol-phosphate aminotransferase